MIPGLKLSWVTLYRSVLLDIALLGILLVLNAFFPNLWWPTTQRGFFCDDETLMYPYHENTVSSTMLHWIGVYLPLAALVILEICRCWRTVGSKWQQFWPVYNTLRWFLFGLGAGSLIKNMGKHTIGRLRPHFFEVCRPQLPDGTFCTDEAHSQGGIYHMVYTCRTDLSGATADMLVDVHVSFPSGHSSMAFYGLIFMALHLQRTRWPSPASLLRPLWQLLCIGIASFVGLSRIMDYKHHWSDVVAGSLLGSIVALAVVCAAEKEQRIYLESIKQQQHQQQQHANTTMAPHLYTDDEVDKQAVGAGAAPDVGRGGVGEQLPPHDLCVITCHSSN